MDQLTAYRILGLEPGCTPEEIRAAYAALSKKFHPEEQPDEFRTIHEAYRLLTRGNRRRKVPDENSYDSDFHEVCFRQKNGFWKNKDSRVWILKRFYSGQRKY